jgi:serine phosphatase RsbU (regulator of sigma subunit)
VNRERDAAVAARLRALEATGLLDSPPEEAFDRFTKLASKVIRVPVAIVSLVDEHRQFFKSHVGLGEPWATKRETPLSHSFCQRVVTSGKPLVVSDARLASDLRDNPAIAELGIVAYAGMPLQAPDGTVIGSLCAVDHTPREWTVGELDILADLAAAVSSEIALRATASSERVARSAAERAGEHLRFLAEASSVLAGSLDYQATLHSVARLAVPRFADWCLVHLRSGNDHLERAALTGPDPALEQRLARRHSPGVPDLPSARIGPARVVETGRAEMVSEISDELLIALARDEHQLQEIRRLGIHALVMAPLIARGQELGVMTFVATAPERRYTLEDLGLLEELARRCAMAIDNARLYRDRDTIARVLQANLLPPRLPSVPGIELGAYFHPYGSGAQVGGDFYDAFEVADGTWLLVVGDVCGKGAQAATVTGLARQTLRAAAGRHSASARLLLALNDTLFANAEEYGERFCTLACLRLSTADGSATANVACAGHPVPLIRRSNGVVEPVDCEGTALGLFPRVEVTDTAVRLYGGDLLIAYTDGVTDARNPGTGQLFGIERLLAVLKEAGSASAQEAADALGNAALDWQGGMARDDVAILALRVEEEGRSASEG